MRPDDDSFFANDADFEQAALQAAGNAASRGRRRMMALRAVGQLEPAARACHHGAGYPTNSPAAHAENDPRAGQRGMRCSACGSWWKGAVSFHELRDTPADAPCELPAR